MGRPFGKSKRRSDRWTDHRTTTDPDHWWTDPTHGNRVKVSMPIRTLGRVPRPSMALDQHRATGSVLDPETLMGRGLDGDTSSRVERVMTSRIVGPKALVGKLPFCH